MSAEEVRGGDATAAVRVGKHNEANSRHRAAAAYGTENL